MPSNAVVELTGDIAIVTAWVICSSATDTAAAGEAMMTGSGSM